MTTLMKVLHLRCEVLFVYVCIFFVPTAYGATLHESSIHHHPPAFLFLVQHRDRRTAASNFWVLLASLVYVCPPRMCL